ncbi:olfactory receptor 10A7-like [Trachemys scripta elegans]|uniref:olfactory receptor 10A7-like n=1 Tax=Trachemys scripta elegans TaxID=31138 RepID=UPI0015576971|nr:olfactory receptor 10A7-like [Trachemys scripta elegans]
MTGNHTDAFRFILLGFSDHPQLHLLFFPMFLATYMMTLTGNVLILTITMADAALHTPMYFFLKVLSILEICYTSVTVPKMLVNLLSGDKSISFLGCATQMYFFVALGGVECFLLAAMAYDRYVAICHPLHYPSIMNHTKCMGLASGSWLSGLVGSLGHVIIIFNLHFCVSHEINHFFCDITPVLKLACGVTFLNKVVIFTILLIFIPLPFILILVSYLLIIFTILKIPSVQGRRKAFSTCSSHLIVVTLFYGTGIINYLHPSSTSVSGMGKILSLSYSVITPMLNPITYSLRNKEVRDALKRTIIRKCFLN